MRIVRFSVQNKIKYGLLEGEVIRGLRGNPFVNYKPGSFRFEDNKYNLRDVKLLAPCTPSKIIALGLNYRSHVEEAKLPFPAVPLIFLKPSTAIIGPDDNIVLPRGSGRVDYEGELTVVIGKKAKDVPEEKVFDYIMGYTCLNDVSERDVQKLDGQWTRGKGYDTFAPMGPWIETEANPGNLKLETFLNGELRQSANTSDLIFGVPKLVSFISAAMTLLPGDVIATGTTKGVGQMKPGDVVEIKIEKIGTLRNHVVQG